MAKTNPFRELADMPLVECPHCGAQAPDRRPDGWQMTCSGSFTDRDHPSDVLMVSARAESDQHSGGGERG